MVSGGFPHVLLFVNCFSIARWQVSGGKCLEVVKCRADLGGLTHHLEVFIFGRDGLFGVCFFFRSSFRLQWLSI